MDDAQNVHALRALVDLAVGADVRRWLAPGYDGLVLVWIKAAGLVLVGFSRVLEQ